MAETIGSVELDLQRRVTPDGIMLLYSLCLLHCRYFRQLVVSDVKKVEVGTTRR
jgi:hypothetical protein